MWKPKTQNISESTKLSAWRACVLCMFTCLGAQMLGLLTCLACLRASALTCLACLRAWCACVRVYVLVMMKCFIFLRVCVLCVLFFLICFTSQYLNLKILTTKNKCALLSWTYLFTFWYKLIKLFELNLRVAVK